MILMLLKKDEEHVLVAAAVKCSFISIAEVFSFCKLLQQ